MVRKGWISWGTERSGEEGFEKQDGDKCNGSELSESEICWRDEMKEITYLLSKSSMWRIYPLEMLHGLKEDKLTKSLAYENETPIFCSLDMFIDMYTRVVYEWNATSESRKVVYGCERMGMNNGSTARGRKSLYRIFVSAMLFVDENSALVQRNKQDCLSFYVLCNCERTVSQQGRQKMLVRPEVCKFGLKMCDQTYTTLIPVQWLLFVVEWSDVAQECVQVAEEDNMWNERIGKWWWNRRHYISTHSMATTAKAIL